MSRETDTSQNQEIAGYQDLLKVFQNGMRPKKNFLLGLEAEFLCLNANDATAARFDGPNGIEALLKDLSSVGGWEQVFNGDKVIGLKHGGTAITLEPGGQFEYSSRPHIDLLSLSEEFYDFCRTSSNLARKRGINLVHLGVEPVSRLADMPWMPKFRYEIMRRYYEERKGMALEMMTRTASVQSNMDYENEADAKTKVFVGSAIGPLVGALYANSAVEEGKLNGYVNKRLVIWQNTDSDRCGVPEFFMDGTFSFERYMDWALDIPMYFIVRDGKYFDRTHVTFRKYIKGATPGDVPLISDWVSHLTTLFPDVRVKDHLEFRTADIQSPSIVVALMAFWVGLLHDSVSLDQCHQRLKNFSKADVDQAMTDVALRGLKARIGNEEILMVVKDLMDLSVQGLSRLDLQNQTHDLPMLEPLRNLLERGESSAEMIRRTWENNPLSLAHQNRLRGTDD